MTFSTLSYLLVAWCWTVCYGFVLLSSAAAGTTDQQADLVVFPAGGSWKYNYEITLLMNEAGAGKDVGYFVSMEIKLDSIWKSSSKPVERLFKIELISPQLHIKSRKAPAPEGFVYHTSPLDKLSNKPFLVHWSQGKVQSIFVPKDEPLSMVNLKKGVASLFQFQLLDQQINETDASGSCLTEYKVTSPTTFTKTKKFCRASEDTPHLVHPDDLFSVTISSQRESNYKISKDSSYIDSIKSTESHEMTVNIRSEAGSKVSITQDLKFVSTDSISAISTENLEDVVERISGDLGLRFSHESLMTERESKMCQDSECPSFEKVVSENLVNIKSDTFGKVKGASGFLKILEAARRARKDEILKVLSNKKYKDMLPALYDIIGASQTVDCHEVAMRQLKLTDEEDLNNIERYLWALSMGSHPQKEIIQDLLNRYIKTSNLNEKVQETLILTIASMTDKYKRGLSNKGKNKIYNSVRDAIYNGIENCEKKPCQYYYIRALKNLRSEETIPKLLQIALNSKDPKSSVTAMKSLKAFPASSWNENVIKTAQKIFYQIPKKFDSSSRTLALDIILGTNPTEETTNQLMYYLLSNDKAFEIKKYTIQKLNMLAEKDLGFAEKLQKVIKKDPKINNYCVLSQRGVSSALARQFLHHPITNGTMFSNQEMSSGLVKRGVFDIVLENDERSCEMFSLGLFSGGLSSMISSDDADENAENEAATAGIEISLLGTQVRPFVFFNGQGELMGHVWSGTASESTTAFQMNTLLHDHLEYIRLAPGVIAEFNVRTAISFNLAGEIQISLWNRNSHSLINENAGIVMQGLLRVDTSFVQSQVEFIMSTEPKLDLESDIEFASGVAVCLRLKQPTTIFKHNIFKIERIPGSKHKLRKAKYKMVEIPGKTYNLNHKNNEMCNTLMQFR